jgi:uncharacterized protein (DUF4415 family)
MPSKKLQGFEEFTLDELKQMAFEDDDIVFDDDNPEWTEERWAKAQSIDELPSDLRAKVLAAFPKTRVRGPQKSPTKEAVSLRLSSEVLDHYRATGRGWQTRIDETLKAAIKKAG